MSETATATPAAENVSFADALDVGIQGLDTQPQETQAPAQETKVPEPVVEKTKAPEISKTNQTVKNPFDVVADRFLNKEESTTTQSEDLDIKTPDNLKPEAQTAWARLTKDLREARAKLKELEVKTTETPKDSLEQIDLKAQLDALKSERDEYENELRFSRLESTREYKQAVTEPLNAIQKHVADIAAHYEADPRLVYSAMMETDPAKRRSMLKEATASFDPVDSLSVWQKAEELQKVFQSRELLTKDVNTVLQMLENDERQEIEAHQTRMQQELDNAYKSEWASIQKENPLLRPIEGNENWNNTLKSIEQQALQIENSELAPNQKARLTFNAAALPVVMEVFKDYVTNAQKRISELESVNKEIRSATPSAGAEGISANDIPSDLSFLEALERGMK